MCLPKEAKYPLACVSQSAVTPSTAQVVLNPYEAAALTRLVMAFCLGKGSICLYSRSYVLQVAQPNRCGEYSRYQWRRLCQFIPTAKQPRFHPMDAAAANPETDKGQWRLRISSRWFETAYNMLYPLSHADPSTGYRPFQVEPETLDLLGAEAIASLWADRGRLLVGGRRLRGQLGLTRMSFAEGELVQQWIARLTGAHSKLDVSPRNGQAPMLFFATDDILNLLQALRPIWMAQAPCLAHKFQPPEELRIAPSQSRELDRQSKPPQRRRRRAVPSLEKPRPLAPPLLQRAS